jgi:2-isopropylmalate synthase
MDERGTELSAADLWDIFESEYRLDELRVEHQAIDEAEDGRIRLSADVSIGGRSFTVAGEGNGPVDAFVTAIAALTGESVQVLDYHEHAIDSGAQAKAAAYLELRIGQRPTLFGVGIDANILSASMKAVLSGMQRAGAMNVDHRSVQWATS